MKPQASLNGETAFDLAPLENNNKLKTTDLWPYKLGKNDPNNTNGPVNLIMPFLFVAQILYIRELKSQIAQ